ncbi:hypothetical protein X777_05790, partial [Ooceraea biroi]
FDCTAISGGLDWSEEFCTANVNGLDSLLPAAWVTKSCRVSPGITLRPGPMCCKRNVPVPEVECWKRVLCRRPASQADFPWNPV